MEEFLQLYEPDELLTLVGLNGGKSLGRTAVGFYRSREKFKADAARLSGQVNLYTALNRVHQDCYGRAADRFKPYAQQTFSADEIIWRPRGCVDIDPVRISGINSTDAELQAALDLGCEVLDYIESEWNERVTFVMSGNGVQLLFRINEPPASTLVDNFLSHVAHTFDNPRVKIDTSLGDLPQLIRVPNTLNMKGDDIEERPRRMAQVMEVQHAA